MDLGKAIKEIRKKKGINQKELSKKCEISANALCQIEIGNSFPSKQTIYKLCKSLEIPVSYLLFYSITEEDVPEEKKEVFHALASIKDLLIN